VGIAGGVDVGAACLGALAVGALTGGEASTGAGDRPVRLVCGVWSLDLLKGVFNRGRSFAFGRPADPRVPCLCGPASRRVCLCE
jgi:hypothetical protein